MAPSGFGLSWLSIFVLASLLIAQTQALHLYLQEKQKKCFFEDLPKDTLVVGTWNSTFPLKIPILRPELGSYKVESLDLPTNTWIEDPTGQVLITVEETFDNDHRVVNQRTKRNGRFTFTAADAGQHRFCYTPLPGNTKGASDAPVKLTGHRHWRIQQDRERGFGEDGEHSTARAGSQQSDGGYSSGANLPACKCCSVDFLRASVG